MLPLQIEMLCYAALGAFALWMRLKYGNFSRGFDQFVNEIADDFSLRIVLQIVLFVIFGAVISIILADPTTKKQALAAGMAWTAMLSGPRARTKKG